MGAPDSLGLLARGRLLFDQDIDAYHGGEGISKTGLDRIARSPAHFYAFTLDPSRPPEKERAGQLEGQLAHCAILEPGEFDKRYIVGPDVNRNTKAWKEFLESAGGRIAIKPDQREAAMRQAESVRRLPDIAEALATGNPEVSAYWTDPRTGVLCRCRPDWVHPVGDDAVILLDVKTYSDASPEEFARQCARKAYHKQAAYYSDGYAAASGKRVLAFIFVAVETDWPHAASATMLDDQAIEQGRIEYRRNLETYAQCLKTGQWPGYSTGIETVSLPRWAITDVEVY